MGDVPAPSSDEIRTQYAEDRELKASVIPSGRTAQQGGGSYGFDANDPNITQNIIVCEDGEMTKVAEVTRAQLAGAAKAPPPTEGASPVGPPPPAEMERRALETESFYKHLTASEKVSADLPPQQATVMEYKEQKQLPQPVSVTIKGPFGKIKQPFSKVFRDGMFLILKVDHKWLDTSYELPEMPEDEALQLELQINDHVIQCIWAGIQFTEPDASATFTVLLIQDETDIEEGRLR